MINVDEKSTKNVKMKKVIEKKFLKKKRNFHTIMFDVVDVRNSNTMIFIKYHIDDTITISNNFTKFFFEFENSLKKKSATQAQKKKQKKEKNFQKKNKNENFEKIKENETEE